MDLVQNVFQSIFSASSDSVNLSISGPDFNYSGSGTAIEISTNTFLTGDGTPLYYKYELGKIATCNRVGDVFTGAIEFGNADSGFTATRPIFPIKFRYYQYDLGIQNNNLDNNN